MIETIDNYLNETEINNFYNCLKHPNIPWFIGPDHSDSTIKNKSFVKGFVGGEIDFLINDFNYYFLENNYQTIYYETFLNHTTNHLFFI